jgi:hypothetical protein
VSVRASIAGLLLGVVGAMGACFDGAEEIEGLKCADDSHCPGKFRCVPLGIDVDGDLAPDSECQELDSCAETGVDCSASATQSTTVSTTDPTVSTTDPTVSTTDPTASSAESTCRSEGDSCAGGEACCSGTCADYGAGLVCTSSCSSGVECLSSCCCVSGLTIDGYEQNVCGPTNLCGQEASCTNPGYCSSPGSECYYDADCCNGRCVPNISGITQCFKTCTVPTDCVSGCCNYKSDLGTYLCEASC